MSREAAIEALQSALSGAYAFGLVTRRLQAPEQMCSVGSPGLALVTHHEGYHRPSPNVPPKRTMTVSALIYVDAGGANPNAVPDSLVNPILDAFDVVFHPQTGANFPTQGRCTLGGTVFSAAISGEVIRAPGDKTGKGVAIVPIELILP